MLLFRKSFVQISVELRVDFSSRMDSKSVDFLSQPPVKASYIETPTEADAVKVPASRDGIKHTPIGSLALTTVP